MPILNPSQGMNGASSIPTTKVLPDGYEYRKSVEGALQVWKVDITPNVLVTSQNVGEFDVNGSLRAAINTIYLEEAHSIKSSGEEVVFKNLESNIFFTPLWQYTSENGESIGEAAILVEDATSTDYFQNGTVDTGLNVPCVDTYTTTDNGSVYQFIVKAGENYSGKIILELRNSLNKAVFREERNFNVSIGQNIVFDKLLYRVRVGNVRTFSLLKSDGNPLLVKSGLDNTKPWVKVIYRGFQDRKVVHVDASGKIPTSELPQIDTVERNTVTNQAARLALPVSTKFRITIQNDVQRQFYLDPNLDPSISANWVDGGSVASAVTSFNSRTGNVTPQVGDYTASQVGAVAVPANDGARRVLIGSVPTLENIVNDLTTDSTLQPLSAAQGKVLKDTKQDNITGAASTITTNNLNPSSVVVTDSNGKVSVSNNISAAELGYLDGVTSNIQSQINAKQPTITGAATTVTTNNLTTSRVLVSDSNGKIAGSLFSYSDIGAILPVTTNLNSFGSDTKWFKEGWFQYINFMADNGVNEGTLDADNGSLGLFGTTELAIGYGNNNKDLTFTISGLTLSKDLTILNGNSLKFEDADSTAKEGVNLRMNGNNLAFYGVNQGVEETVPAAEITFDSRLLVRHNKRGYDLVSSVQPQAVYRDKFLTSGTAATTVVAANVPWVYADISEAERSLPYWIQELTTFFKNLENDNQFDQLIGAIPATFSIPQGSWGVTPSSGTDMDNNMGSGTTYASESFELIVGRNPAGTEIYTFGFTFTQFANAAYDSTCLHPFRMIYQTTRGASAGFSGQTVTAIAGSTPRCTARSNSFTVGSYLSTGFPLMFEPITLEINK